MAATREVLERNALASPAGGEGDGAVVTDVDAVDGQHDVVDAEHAARWGGGVDVPHADTSKLVHRKAASHASSGTLQRLPLKAGAPDAPSLCVVNEVPHDSGWDDVPDVVDVGSCILFKRDAHATSLPAEDWAAAVSRIDGRVDLHRQELNVVCVPDHINTRNNPTCHANVVAVSRISDNCHRGLRLRQVVVQLQKIQSVPEVRRIDREQR
mmetsp:Transcript_53627/g.149205  ORF Transcript_53627/g.149205 Transcript_53627/m.149205 type:complete len:211 (+) Transcript_53627:587-1219(+)